MAYSVPESISPELVLVTPELGPEARAALPDRPWEHASSTAGAASDLRQPEQTAPQSAGPDAGAPRSPRSHRRLALALAGGLAAAVMAVWGWDSAVGPSRTDTNARDASPPALASISRSGPHARSHPHIDATTATSGRLISAGVLGARTSAQATKPKTAASKIKAAAPKTRAAAPKTKAAVTKTKAAVTKTKAAATKPKRPAQKHAPGSAKTGSRKTVSAHPALPAPATRARGAGGATPATTQRSSTRRISPIAGGGYVFPQGALRVSKDARHVTLVRLNDSCTVPLARRTVPLGTDGTFRFTGRRGGASVVVLEGRFAASRKAAVVLPRQPGCRIRATAATASLS